MANDLEASTAFTEVMRILKPLSEIACASVLSKVARHYGYTIEEIVVNPPTPATPRTTTRPFHGVVATKAAPRTVDDDTDPDMPYVVPLDQIDDKTPKREPLSPDGGRRGVDFPCEKCGALAGSSLDDGWYRCHSCGHPSK